MPRFKEQASPDLINAMTETETKSALRRKAIHAFIDEKCRLGGREYTLASGKTVENYFNLKILLCTGSIMFETGRELQYLLAKEFPGVIRYGGEGIGGRLTTALMLSSDGENGRVNGQQGFDVYEDRDGIMKVGNPPPSGSDIVLVDDVATTGGSLLKVKSYVSDCNIAGVLVILDRSHGKAEEVIGVPVKSIFTIDDFS